MLCEDKVSRARFVKAYFEQEEQKDCCPSDGVEVNTKYIHIGSRIVKQKVYNTCSNPSLASYLKSYYDYVNGVMLLHDL